MTTTGCTQHASGWDDLSDAKLLDLARGGCDCVAEAAALELADRERRGVLTTTPHHHRPGRHYHHWIDPMSGTDTVIVTVEAVALGIMLRLAFRTLLPGLASRSKRADRKHAENRRIAAARNELLFEQQRAAAAEPESEAA